MNHRYIQKILPFFVAFLLLIPLARAQDYTGVATIDTNGGYGRVCIWSSADNYTHQLQWLAPADPINASDFTDGVTYKMVQATGNNYFTCAMVAFPDPSYDTWVNEALPSYPQAIGWSTQVTNVGGLWYTTPPAPPAPALDFSGLTLLSVPTQSTAVSAVGASVIGSIDSIWGLSVLVIALPLTFYILQQIIMMFGSSMRDRKR